VGLARPKPTRPGQAPWAGRPGDRWPPGSFQLRPVRGVLVVEPARRTAVPGSARPPPGKARVVSWRSGSGRLAVVNLDAQQGSGPGPGAGRRTPDRRRGSTMRRQADDHHRMLSRPPCHRAPAARGGPPPPPPPPRGPEDGHRRVIGRVERPARRASGCSSIGVSSSVLSAIQFLTVRLRTIRRTEALTARPGLNPLTLRPAQGPGGDFCGARWARRCNGPGCMGRSLHSKARRR